MVGMEPIIGRFLTSLDSSRTMEAPAGDDNSRGKVQNVLGDSSAIDSRAVNTHHLPCAGCRDSENTRGIEGRRRGHSNHAVSGGASREPIHTGGDVRVRGGPPRERRRVVGGTG